jgi:4-amino-4-deoxy-L-arabinose transferase-like glycosyltransferase
VFYYYTVNPMPDNMALCCAIWSIGFFCRFLNGGKFGHAVLSAAFLGLATLTKLPFVLYGSFPFTWLLMHWWKRDQTAVRSWRIWLAYILFIIPAAVWYAAVIPGWHSTGIVKGIFDLGHDTPDLWHVFTDTVVSTLPELLINYGAVLFLVAGPYFMFRKKLYHRPLFLCFLLWGASCIFYFLFEMNMIDTVHDYYLFLFLPPIFLLVAYGAFLLAASSRWLRMLSIVCIAILPITAFLRADSRWDKELPGFNPLYLHNKEQLRALIPENALCVAGNDESGFILLYYIDRKGWTFDHDQLNSETLAYYISKGAKFLFSDSRTDEDGEVKEHIAETIFEKGTLRIYRLK